MGGWVATVEMYQCHVVVVVVVVVDVVAEIRPRVSRRFTSDSLRSKSWRCNVSDSVEGGGRVCLRLRHACRRSKDGVGRSARGRTTKGDRRGGVKTTLRSCSWWRHNFTFALVGCYHRDRSPLSLCLSPLLPSRAKQKHGTYG